MRLNSLNSRTEKKRVCKHVIGFKNISDLVSKEIHSMLKAKNPTKEQIKKYKMTEEKF